MSNFDTLGMIKQRLEILYQMVDELEKSGGGGGEPGTTNYNDLTNKPSVNGHILIGSKTSSDLDLQSVISDLSTIRSGAAAGATAVQPATMNQALRGKQDTLTFDTTPTSGSTNPVKSGGVYTSLTTKVDKVAGKGLSTNDFTNADKAQITTNKNNISKDEAALIELVDGGAKNKIKYKSELVAGYSVTKGEVTFIVNDDLSITATSNGANVAARRTLSLYSGVALHSNGDIISGGLSSQCTVACELNENPYTNYGTDEGTGTRMTTASGNVQIFVRVEAGASVNVTFKPMICSNAAWDISQTYQPYRPSYQELYEMILALQ